MESAWYTINVKYNANSKSCRLKCVKDNKLPTRYSLPRSNQY